MYKITVEKKENTYDYKVCHNIYDREYSTLYDELEQLIIDIKIEELELKTGIKLDPKTGQIENGSEYKFWLIKVPYSDNLQIAYLPLYKYNSPVLVKEEEMKLYKNRAIVLYYSNKYGDDMRYINLWDLKNINISRAIDLEVDFEYDFIANYGR